MAEWLRSLRLLGDAGRVRMLRLLAREELSVAELQEILGMGQSRISMQLSQLRHAELVEVRRLGQKSLYRLSLPRGTQPILTDLLRLAGEEIEDASHDDEALRLILQRRKDKLRDYIDALAGRFGRDYVPGRSWRGMAEMLLKLMPPLVIADLGAGEGTLALLLAQRAERVIAVDHSEKMRAYALDLANKSKVKNLEYRLGDLEELPVSDGEAEVALFHQSLHHALHPAQALNEAFRVLKPGGRLIILDLAKHRFEDARELYADVWLGFSQAELSGLLNQAGFRDVEVTAVDREAEAPHFETVLAVGAK